VRVYKRKGDLNTTPTQRAEAIVPGRRIQLKSPIDLSADVNGYLSFRVNREVDSEVSLSLLTDAGALSTFRITAENTIEIGSDCSVASTADSYPAADRLGSSVPAGSACLVVIRITGQATARDIVSCKVMDPDALIPEREPFLYHNIDDRGNTSITTEWNLSKKTVSSDSITAIAFEFNAREASCKDFRAAPNYRAVVHEPTRTSAKKYQVNLAGRPPDITVVEPFFQRPDIAEGPPAAGKLVRHQLAEYQDTDVHHLLYLPENWDPREKYPVLIEYNGNGAYVDQSKGFGYGISGGRDYIWAVLPFVNKDRRTEADWWWGKKEYTVEYAKKAVPMICRAWGGDPDRVVLVGCSRGAIACNYIGLHDDEIAQLWRAMVPNSHYDAIREWNWGMSDEDKYRAVERVKRLGETPQFICGEYHLRENHTDANDLKAVRDGRYTDMAVAVRELDLVPQSERELIREFITRHYPQGNITFVDLPFVNHTSAWVFMDIPEREMVRSWLREVLR
jgi:hypothetical protein